jgi:hypothetical protein
MKKVEHVQKDEIGALSAIAQLTTIIAPLLYLLGRKYASAYFDSLGCGWVISHLTIQESIFYSLPITVPILAAIFLSLEILLNGTSYQTLRRTLIYAFIAFFLIVTVCSFFWSFNYLEAMSRLFAYGFFVSFGIYISEIFLAVKRNDAPNLKAAIAWVIGSTVIIYGAAATLGSVDASRALESPEKIFPLMTKGSAYGRPQALRLVSKIGDKYLLIDQASGKNLFRIESNIDGYIIQSLDNIR